MKPTALGEMTSEYLSQHPAVAYLFLVRPMRLFVLALVLVATTLFASANEDITKYAQWITGDMFLRDGILAFRADKPVQGNRTGDVVLVGPTRDGVNTVGPLLVRAAERKLKVRLYGVLQQTSTSFPGHHEKLPSVQFIVWKVHVPTDPDDLSPGEKIIFGPNDKIPGYKVVIPK
jgi:hypothetical protein